MIDIQDDLYKDYETITKIALVPTMLEVICRTTGMGFAAIARVTEDRWLACSVRDEVQFGLEAGGELKVETTLCNEVRDNRTPIVIDNVDKDENYRQHHTPKIYGLQSYISFPIILKNGVFFGTLCAIDSKPAELSNPKVIGTFKLFAELLSFHLQSLEWMEHSELALQETNRQLSYTRSENSQYREISNHNLKEPIRKIRMFSDILTNRTDATDLNQVKALAEKINLSAERLDKMLGEVSSFSTLTYDDTSFEQVDLNDTLLEVCSQLAAKLREKDIVTSLGKLPVLQAIPPQMAQLFFYLIQNTITFAKKDTPCSISISCAEMDRPAIEHLLPAANKSGYCKITIANNGVEIDNSALEKIFDIFIHLDAQQANDRYGTGLAYCRKIVHNHGGIITAQAIAGQGTTFSIILPATQTA